MHSLSLPLSLCLSVQISLYDGDDDDNDKTPTATLYSRVHHLALKNRPIILKLIFNTSLVI